MLVNPGSALADREIAGCGRAIGRDIEIFFTLGRRTDVVAGGLMSYGPIAWGAIRQVGICAARVLKGEKPADLPVMQSTKFEFAINLQAAKLLGIEAPPTLLATAHEVVE